MAWTTEGVREAWFWPTRESRTELKELIRLALPGAFTILVECFNWESLAILSGIIGTNYLAAQVIVINIGYMSFISAMGFMQGSIIIIGQALGQNKPKLALSESKLCTSTNFTIMFISITVVFFCAPQIVKMYQPGELVYPIAVSTLQFFCIGFLIDGCQMFLQGILRACGKQKVAAITGAGSYFLLCLPVNYVTVFVMGWKLHGLAIGFSAFSFGMTFVFTIVVCRLDWNEIAKHASQIDLKQRDSLVGFKTIQQDDESEKSDDRTEF